MELYYVIIKNDGTDEIYNLNGIICEDLGEFKTKFKMIFDPIRLGHPTYYICRDSQEYAEVLRISHKNTEHSHTEMVLLNLVDSLTVQYNNFRMKLPIR
jgi:hypothetical protein